MLDARSERRRTRRAHAAVLVGALALAGAAGAAVLVRRPPGPAAGEDGAAARHAAAAEDPRWLPGFAIDLGDRVVSRAPGVADCPRQAGVATADVVARVRRAGPSRFELEVEALRPVRAVAFPWHTRVSQLDLGSPATTVLYPVMLGVAARAPAALRLGFDRRRYPGECFAPLVVVTDGAVAEVVAAVNWPPRTVVPAFDAHGLEMRYGGLAAGARATFGALIARYEGDAAGGAAPWLQGALAYRRWLRPHLRRAGLDGADAPRWLREIEGWQNVQLQNLARFDAGELEARWRRWRDLLPWLQLWGQMSGYAGRPARGGAAAEEVGCCIDRTALHERYRGALAAATARVAREGRVGLYARPRSPYRPLGGDDGTAGAERAFLLGWLARQRDELGANAFYVDVLGHRHFGEPLAVAEFVRDALPPETVIEYAVDVYPRPALVSGSLTGGSIGGGPAREPRELASLGVERTTFPRFGRAVLGDAILFLGESNGDHVLWGRDAGHWAERQAFLLGAKLDVMRPSAAPERPDEPNEALREIVARRREARWGQRRPVYLDRLGVSALADGIDVRRFRGADGEDLLAVDNWQRRRGATVRVDGREVALGDERLSVVVLPAGG